MAEAYRIVEVKPKPGVNQPEAMGTREKFWYRDRDWSQDSDDERDWLFKYPRPNTGEHWAEKIVAEVADAAGIEHAKVELAQFQDSRGSITESFVQDGVILRHGNQILETHVPGYSSAEKRFKQSQHTLKNIWEVMKNAREARLVIAGYTVLDALVGNTDRHHENWGALLWRGKDSWEWRIAPSFDHASSLGRELTDKRRNELLNQNRVGGYVEKGHGGIYWSQDERRGPSPLELVRRATRDHPDLYRPAASNLARIDENDLDRIVNRIPSDWMSPPARTFTVEMMRYNYRELQEVLQ